MREAMRSDLPKGAEAQCPLCWRIFSGDKACEMHKRYDRSGPTVCQDPNGLSYEPRGRRGLVIWYRTRPAPVLADLRRRMT